MEHSVLPIRSKIRILNLTSFLRFFKIGIKNKAVLFFVKTVLID